MQQLEKRKYIISLIIVALAITATLLYVGEFLRVQHKPEPPQSILIQERDHTTALLMEYAKASEQEKKIAKERALKNYRVIDRAGKPNIHKKEKRKILEDLKPYSSKQIYSTYPFAFISNVQQAFDAGRLDQEDYDLAIQAFQEYMINVVVIYEVYDKINYSVTNATDYKENGIIVRVMKERAEELGYDLDYETAVKEATDEITQSIKN
jgi:hypothetical protein